MSSMAQAARLPGKTVGIATDALAHRGSAPRSSSAGRVAVACSSASAVSRASSTSSSTELEFRRGLHKRGQQAKLGLGRGLSFQEIVHDTDVPGPGWSHP